MTSGARLDTSTDERRRRSPSLLIDTDVHELMYSKRDLMPYLSEYWKNVFDTHFFDMAPFAPNAGYLLNPPNIETRPEWRLGGEGWNKAGQSLEALQEHLLEGEGVTTAILNGLFYPECYPAHFEFAAALAAAYNDWQIENWLDRDPRLYGSVHVVTDDPQVAVREIDRVAAHPQIVQVLLPYTPRKHYGDPIYRPVFEAAARNQLAVAMHHYLDVTTAIGVPRTYFEFHVLSATQAAQAQLMSILAGGIFDLFPELKLVLLESGVAWVPWLMLRADENYKAFRSEVPWVKRSPSEHIRNNVRIATQPFGDIKWRQFLTLVEMVDAEDVFVFATDYPHYDSDSFRTAFPPAVPERIRRKISHENALDAYPRLGHLRPTVEATVENDD